MITDEAVRVPLPTPFGQFEAHAFESESDHVYVAMVHGDLGTGSDVLVRLHSECLTGDALGSLRCDCGVQLRQGLRTIAADGRGVLVYATGHEGRGIGLISKLRAYVAQDAGADTVDANVALGLPVDSRDYSEAAAVLQRLGVTSVRLLTNNPRKVAALREAGMHVAGMVPLPTAPHHRNVSYLRTKAARMGHVLPTLGPTIDGLEANGVPPPADAVELLGPVRPTEERPHVVLKYAQSLDGRIATATGDSKWISGEPERRLSHALRAACDAVLVGVATAIRDRAQLTVRLVPGASPTRVVLDSTLRLPEDAPVLGPEATTTIITTGRSDPAKRAALRARGVGVAVVDADDRGRVDVAAALADLRAQGIESLLVEGGASVITSLLDAALVDRVIVGVAPVILGGGVEAVGSLGIDHVVDGVHLRNRSVVMAGDDVVLAWDVRS
jgi:3,4-dihydroxy 2-butanone 4-phosphate synthase/GTP cyclohydrolase II